MNSFPLNSILKKKIESDKLNFWIKAGMCLGLDCDGVDKVIIDKTKVNRLSRKETTFLLQQQIFFYLMK